MVQRSRRGLRERADDPSLGGEPPDRSAAHRGEHAARPHDEARHDPDAVRRRDRHRLRRAEPVLRRARADDD